MAHLFIGDGGKTMPSTFVLSFVIYSRKAEDKIQEATPLKKRKKNEGRLDKIQEAAPMKSEMKSGPNRRS